MTFFEADKISINFGDIRAVDGVSFKVARDEVFTVIGPNGAGKTTIFNLVSRFYDPTDGRLIFEDNDITRVPAHRIAALGIALLASGLTPYESWASMLLLAATLSLLLGVILLAVLVAADRLLFRSS